LSKSCRSRQRCLFCGEATHGASESCAQKQSPPKCINCGGDHLATSHECPRVVTHKMALSLAATENIPFADALKSVSSSLPSSPVSVSVADPRFDFHNFPPLPRHRSSRSPPNFSSPNSFTALSNLSASGDPSVPIKSFSSTLRDSPPVASRPWRGPRPKQSSPYSSSSLPAYLNNRHQHNSVHAFSKDHSDLLLHPHGRSVSSPAEFPEASTSRVYPSMDHNMYSAPSETQLEDIQRFLSNPADILQHLLFLLRGLAVPPDLTHNTYPPSLLPRLRPFLPSHDSYSPSSWARDSPSQP